MLKSSVAPFAVKIGFASLLNLIKNGISLARTAPNVNPEYRGKYIRRHLKHTFSPGELLVTPTIMAGMHTVAQKLAQKEQNVIKRIKKA
jgi:hypothetical protein